MQEKKGVETDTSAVCGTTVRKPRLLLSCDKLAI